MPQWGSFQWGQTGWGSSVALTASTATPETFPHDVYSYLIGGIRDADRLDGDLFLARFVEAFQEEFEATYARIDGLRLLNDPENCPAAALEYLRWIVGWTARYDDALAGISEADLRALLRVSTRFWKRKGTDAALAVAVEVFSGYPVRIENYLHFRTLSDEAEIGVAALGYDVVLLDRAGFETSVRPDAVTDLGAAGLALDLATLLGPTEAVPHAVRAKYLPSGESRELASFWTGSVNRAVSGDAFGQTSPSTDVDDYRVGVDPDEFVSDLRVVDDGTGRLDRTTLEKVLAAARPSGERFYIRYLSFSDVFRGTDYWALREGSVANVVRDDAGTVALRGDLEGGTVAIETDFPGDAGWTEYVATARFQLASDGAGEYFELRFYAVNAANYYALRLDPGADSVNLIKVVSGVATSLASASIAPFRTGVDYLARVATEDTGAGQQLRVLLDEAVLATVVDSTFNAGRIGLAAAAGQAATVSLAEVYEAPFDSTRVGP